ncbi:unnamed protein product [Phytophthora fragariaefolia]|uniref:Unnamed protein product n=1 Tax=Phytophthora fragariaefolia TaxID=1490495 RepID=A0A9W6XP96_9STRA|nr:unnamed protein product [Phytophthora fragariaefolia]
MCGRRRTTRRYPSRQTPSRSRGSRSPLQATGSSSNRRRRRSSSSRTAGVPRNSSSPPAAARVFAQFNFNITGAIQLSTESVIGCPLDDAAVELRLQLELVAVPEEDTAAHFEHATLMSTMRPGRNVLASVTVLVNISIILSLASTASCTEYVGSTTSIGSVGHTRLLMEAFHSGQ